ncbi:MAG: hypothetical protein KatS3mg014_1784 [Actinomycetota bacterium]|nr:MAG: hypothetical protein KatS3mg014_1784 [Actinomycetota bacterium]
MGDVLTLIERGPARRWTGEKAEESARRLLEARFTLEDFLVQLREVRKLGPLRDLLAMLPGDPRREGRPPATSRAGSTTASSVRAEAIILLDDPGGAAGTPLSSAGARRAADRARLRHHDGPGQRPACEEFEQAREDDEEDAHRRPQGTADAEDPRDPEAPGLSRT